MADQPSPAIEDLILDYLARQDLAALDEWFLFASAWIELPNGPVLPLQGAIPDWMKPMLEEVPTALAETRRYRVRPETQATAPA